MPKDESFRDETTSPGLPAPPLWAQNLAADQRVILNKLGELADKVDGLVARDDEVRSLRRRVEALERPSLRVARKS